METSLKPGFAQIFSCSPKNLSKKSLPPARTPMIKLTIKTSKLAEISSKNSISVHVKVAWRHFRHAVYTRIHVQSTPDNSNPR